MYFISIVQWMLFTLSITLKNLFLLEFRIRNCFGLNIILVAPYYLTYILITSKSSNSAWIVCLSVPCDRSIMQYGHCLNIAQWLISISHIQKKSDGSAKFVYRRKYLLPISLSLDIFDVNMPVQRVIALQYWKESVTQMCLISYSFFGENTNHFSKNVSQMK